MTDTSNGLNSYLAHWAARVEARLEELVTLGDLGVQQAMRYSVLAGGKRLRPVLAIAGHEAAGGNAEDVLDAAASLELIHTYSLIHDDLPAMDDATLRRGKLTCHKKYGEATAILAGDALLPLAFEIIGTSMERFPAERVVRAMVDIARASGDRGMVAGQDLDLNAEGRVVSAEELERIHRLKTGALLESSLRLGAILGGANERLLTALTRYGSAIGLAFQVVDDLLDVESDAQTLGKNPTDQERAKSTYPAILGLERSRALVRELLAEAKELTGEFGATGCVLAELAEFVVARKH